MSGNVVRTGVPLDKPCPDAPDDGYEWIKVAIHDEWRWLRGMRKVEASDGEAVIRSLDGETQIVRTRP